MSIFDNLFGGGSGAVPQSQNPLIDPQGIRQQAAVQGLQALFAGLMAAGQKRPEQQPGPGLGDAFGAFSPAYQRGIQSGQQEQQMQRQAQQEQQMQAYIAGHHELAGLPSPIAQQVIAAQLSRPPRDPRQNFISGYRGQLWDVSSGTPRLVSGQAGAGGAGGDGSGGGAGATGQFGRGAMDPQIYNMLAAGSMDTPQAEALRATPGYALAYRHATQPRFETVPDPNNPMGTILARIPNDLPQGIRPPTFGHAARRHSDHSIRANRRLR